ncbi:molybdenum cofactor synthesis 2 [Coprinopsis marcescibilis]|uniref:Molybdenum cofactor synthesis 2 n=1 Tax=Coprinopsis marcescibilis TaxID=230819 RepID=A0A5C3LCH0_COPMA|nr:molybdenum cofactor synthesis 2 [Coprinopsis marcescibilis]
MESLNHAASTEAHLEVPAGKCVITYSKLDVEKILSTVKDDGSGAIVTFIGTTRNSFQGKVVTRLEYQAYSKLAIKTLATIVDEATQQFHRSDHQPQNETTKSPPLLKPVVYHRLGVVPVGEPSIVIAVSCPHRKEAFRACEYILEEVKKRAQIWKREFYEGEDERTAVWKENV